jgi:pimeloyl-ACP methyl ester carboxylesterase
MPSKCVVVGLLVLLGGACAPAPETSPSSDLLAGADSPDPRDDADGLGAADGDSATNDAGDDGDGPVAGDAGGDAGPRPTDFTKAGPFTATATAHTASVESCDLDYTLFTPATVASPVLVVLGHGFQRDRDNVLGLAAHLASYGVRVVAPSYCHSWIFDTDHAQNAIDAVALAASVAPGEEVIYAGHSAGGLSAVLAAAEDQNARAVLGLDTTDASGLALSAAPAVTVPALGLFGAPSSCNSNGNGTAVFNAVAGAIKLRVVNATHCDFEAPTSAGCTSFCGGTDASRGVTVQALAAAFVAWQTNVDVSGRDWLQPAGVALAELVAQGAVVALP